MTVVPPGEQLSCCFKSSRSWLYNSFVWFCRPVWFSHCLDQIRFPPEDQVHDEFSPIICLSGLRLCCENSDVSTPKSEWLMFTVLQPDLKIRLNCRIFPRKTESESEGCDSLTFGLPTRLRCSCWPQVRWSGEGYFEVKPQPRSLSGTITTLTHCLPRWHTPGTIALVHISV